MILLKAVHGEHYLEIINPIPSSGTLVSEPKIIDVLDKGSGALFIIGGMSCQLVLRQIKILIIYDYNYQWTHLMRTERFYSTINYQFL